MFLMNSSPQIFITIYTSVVWKTFFEEILVLVIHNAKNYPLLIIWMIQKARDRMLSLLQLGCILQSYFKVNTPQFRCRVGFCILNNLYTKYTFHSPHFRKIQKQFFCVFRHQNLAFQVQVKSDFQYLKILKSFCVCV